MLAMFIQRILNLVWPIIFYEKNIRSYRRYRLYDRQQSPASFLYCTGRNMRNILVDASPFHYFREHSAYIQSDVMNQVRIF